jgi:hypothetical protein
VIYRAVDWITRLESFASLDARHPLLGGPTMCVTTIHGGLNIVAFFSCVFATDLALAEEPIPTDLTHLIQPVWNLS